MPTPAGGFAVVLTPADRLDHDELGEWGALADCDRPIADMPIAELAYRLGSAADGLADYLVRELGGEEWDHVELAKLHAESPEVSGPFGKPTEPAIPGVVTYTQEAGAND
jgi:hypothetical protein